MTSTPAATPRSRFRGLVALLAVLSLLAVGLGVTSASAAVGKPSLRTDPGSASSLRVSWTAVSGAKGYRVQYAASAAFTTGVTTLPAKGEIAGTSTTIRGLGVNKTYYVRVADVSSSGKVGRYSPAAAAAPRYPYAAPGDLVRSKVTKSSITVAWLAISGAPGYTVRAYSKGNPTKYFSTTTSAVRLTGLKPKTTYYLSASVTKPATVSTSAVTLSPSSVEGITTTSAYALATPDGFRQTAQGANAVKVAWTPVVGAPAGSSYKVTYALNAILTDGAKTTPSLPGTSATLDKLKADTTYFAAIVLVDKAGKRISGTSDFIVAKPVVPRGRISGEVSGPSGSDLTAAAYDSTGNVAKAVTVGADNTYALDVRPGTYRVQLQYTGTEGFTSAWARAGKAGAWTIGTASPIGVARNATTKAPKVSLGKGHALSGTVVDRGGRGVADVDISAITGATAEREVIALTRTDRNGKFVLRGLNTGPYWIRSHYSGVSDGYKTRSDKLNVTKTLGVKVNLANADFRKRYKAYIQGTRRVGSTVNVWATPWLAGSFPTTRATMSYQWKRNGVAIRGATGKTFKLTKADRGKSITVTATARAVGYNTGSATSNPAKIS